MADKKTPEIFDNFSLNFLNQVPVLQISNESLETCNSGLSLEISNAKIPSIILYKMGFINFMIVKSLIKTKYANIINFAANEEVIPELLQSNCNSKNIFKHVSNFLEDPNKIKEQVNKVQNVLNKLKTNGSSSELASLSLNKFL